MSIAQRVVACRSCGAGIIWTITAATKSKMPVDWKPSPAGTFYLRSIPDEPEPIAEWIPPAQRSLEPQLHTAHHATCPQGREWKWKRAAAVGH